MDVWWLDGWRAGEGTAHDIDPRNSPGCCCWCCCWFCCCSGKKKCDLEARLDFQKEGMGTKSESCAPLLAGSRRDVGCVLALARRVNQLSPPAILLLLLLDTSRTLSIGYHRGARSPVTATTRMVGK